jgi:ECF sigma factor
MTNVTQLLEAAAAGDPKAVTDLLPLAYDELCKLAAARMAPEKPGTIARTPSWINRPCSTCRPKRRLRRSTF